MNANTQHEMHDTAHEGAVLEVLELGEALFDAAIEATVVRPTGASGDDEAFPAKEMRAAADEFFAALRALLETKGGS